MYSKMERPAYSMPDAWRILAFALCFCFAARLGSGAPETIQQQLREANGAFTFEGKAINPLEVLDLLTWISDGVPGPVAVDVEAADSNRYFGKYARMQDGRVTVDLKTTKLNPTEDDRGYFSYRRLGTLPNGLHVVETWWNGGGSGVFTNLLLVKFFVDSEYSYDGSKRDRLVMMRCGEISLGDRYGGAVTVQGNTVHIGADGTNVDKPKVFRFE